MMIEPVRRSVPVPARHARLRIRRHPRRFRQQARHIRSRLRAQRHLVRTSRKERLQIHGIVIEPRIRTTNRNFTRDPDGTRRCNGRGVNARDRVDSVELASRHRRQPRPHDHNSNISIGGRIGGRITCGTHRRDGVSVARQQLGRQQLGRRQLVNNDFVDTQLRHPAPRTRRPRRSHVTGHVTGHATRIGDHDTLRRDHIVVNKRIVTEDRQQLRINVLRKLLTPQRVVIDIRQIRHPFRRHTSHTTPTNQLVHRLVHQLVLGHSINVEGQLAHDMNLRRPRLHTEDPRQFIVLAKTTIRIQIRHLTPPAPNRHRVLRAHPQQARTNSGNNTTASEPEQTSPQLLTEHQRQPAISPADNLTSTITSATPNTITDARHHGRGTRRKPHPPALHTSERPRRRLPREPLQHLRDPRMRHVRDLSHPPIRKPRHDCLIHRAFQHLMSRIERRPRRRDRRRRSRHPRQHISASDRTRHQTLKHTIVNDTHTADRPAPTHPGNQVATTRDRRHRQPEPSPMVAGPAQPETITSHAPHRRASGAERQ